MNKLSVFEYSEPKQFLEDYVKLKRKESTTWSLGSWANKLGVSGTASISRVLNGERIPGENLTRALAKFFKFTNEEERHFFTLWERERFYRREDLQSSTAMIIKNAKVIVLSGSVDLQRASQFLEPLSLDPLIVNGMTIAAININIYSETSFGPFSESHVCIAVKPKNGGLLDTGLYFDGYCYSSERAIQEAKLRWDFKIIQRPIHLSQDNLQMAVHMNSNRDLFFRIAMENRNFKRVSEKYEIFGYSKTPSGIFKAKFAIDTMGRECDFDPMIDTFGLTSNEAASALLSQLAFRPQKWVIHENLFSVVYPPSNPDRVGSY